QDDAPGDDRSTQVLDLAEPDPSASAAETAPVAAAPGADAAPEAVPPLEAPSHFPEAPSGTDAPDGPPPGEEPPADGPVGPWWRRRAVLVPTGALAVLAAAYGVDLLTSSGDIPRSTVVAGVDIGGLSPAAATAVLERDPVPPVVP